jgi:plasmid stabilization system protein ParE
MARLIVSPEARTDISSILAYLRRKAGAAVADKYVDGFDAVTERLVLFPGIGSPQPQLGTDARAAMVEPYLLIYDYHRDRDIVVALRVVHGRRNINRELIRGR